MNDSDANRIVLLQTSDPEAYRGFLDITARVNRAYCERQGITYHAWIGIARGIHPWQATFNRIPILKGFLNAGYEGWVLYLDADAYVADLSVDIRAFLAARAERSIIGALGHNKSLSDLNAGVIFFNFAHPQTRFILEEWHRLFHAEISDEMLAAAAEGWSLRPNDQDLLQRVLRDNLIDLWPGIGIEDRADFNTRDARFVRQVLRKDAPDLVQRMAIAERDVAEILAEAGLA